jgi:phosphatidylinositol kinase/protein kinase (PI-3  family)
MGVLRQNRNSLLAMLEVFLYDPIVSWTLLSQKETDELQGE